MCEEVRVARGLDECVLEDGESSLRVAPLLEDVCVEAVHERASRVCRTRLLHTRTCIINTPAAHKHKPEARPHLQRVRP